MKLYTDLDIVNGLSTCRDMFEAKAYLKANNIAISDQELEVLQSQYSKTNSERTLTKELLNKVAGGMFGMEAHRQEAPKYNGGTFGREANRTRAVRSDLAQYRVDQNSAISKTLDALRFTYGQYYIENCSMAEIMRAVVERQPRRVGLFSEDEAIRAAEALDAKSQADSKRIADLTARVKYYEERYGEIPDLSKVIPGTPPGSP